MPGTPVDKNLQEGLKEQAKLIAVVVHNVLRDKVDNITEPFLNS